MDRVCQVGDGSCEIQHLCCAHHFASPRPSADKSVRLWEVMSQTRVRACGTLLVLPQEVNSVVFTTSGFGVITGCEDNTVRQWDITACLQVAGTQSQTPQPPSSSSQVMPPRLPPAKLVWSTEGYSLELSGVNYERAVGVDAVVETLLSQRCADLRPGVEAALLRRKSSSAILAAHVAALKHQQQQQQQDGTGIASLASTSQQSLAALRKLSSSLRAMAATADSNHGAPASGTSTATTAPIGGEEDEDGDAFRAAMAKVSFFFFFFFFF